MTAPKYNAGRRAALLQLVKGAGPMDNTPVNRKQRRQALRALKRLERKPGKGGAHG